MSDPLYILSFILPVVVVAPVPVGFKACVAFVLGLFAGGAGGGGGVVLLLCMMIMLSSSAGFVCN